MEVINVRNLDMSGAMSLTDCIVIQQNGKLRQMPLSDFMTYMASASVETDSTVRNEGMAADAAATRAYVDGKIVAVSVVLAADSWADNTQTVNVDYVTGDESDTAVIVSPAPESYEAYSENGVRCISQGDGTLTFSCDSAPSGDVTANVIIRRGSYDL